MQANPGSIRNKLMVACALVMACVLAAPTAFAHDRYRNRGNHSADILGALVVGAVIGGVLVGASQHHRDYYDGSYYYPAPYPQPAYYGSYPAYPQGYGYPAYGYGSGVRVGVVYTRGGDRHYGGSYGYYGRRDHRYPGGSHGYYGHRNDGYREGRHGRYYPRHGH